MATPDLEAIYRAALDAGNHASALEAVYGAGYGAGIAQQTPAPVDVAPPQ